MALLLLVFAVVFLWLALHPFTTFPLSLALLARLGIGKPTVSIAPATARPLTFAICTCAYNEEAVIDAKMRNLLALRDRSPGLDILVYVDAAGDRTAAICQPYADRIKLHVADQRHGKTHGMNLLVQNTQADIVIFTDANVVLAVDIVERLRSHFQDEGVGLVCGKLTYVNSAASVTAWTGSVYWRIEERIKRLETATGSVIGADGSLFAMRRDLHRAPPDHIIDDFYVALMVMCQGKRIIQATDVNAFEESVEVTHEEFRRKIRIACQAFNVHRLLWSQVRRLDALTLYKYVSHKLLRWLSIFTLAASFVMALLATVVGGWWILTLLLAVSPPLLWALGSRWPVRPVSTVYDMLVAFTGVGLGVLESLRGKRFQTWSPAASLRK
ncbi:glycosyltransferase family 2 protein [soil metagenome]